NQQMNNLLFQDNAYANDWAWKSSTARRDWNDAMAMRQVNYGNMMAQSRQDWDMQRLRRATRQDEAAWNRAFSIRGRVAPVTWATGRRRPREGRGPNDDR
ncbi:MAG: hypothetical protein ACOZEN_05925, partial [Thermodesulfobacteriota bacterium]